MSYTIRITLFSKFEIIIFKFHALFHRQPKTRMPAHSEIHPGIRQIINLVFDPNLLIHKSVQYPQTKLKRIKPICTFCITQFQHQLIFRLFYKGELTVFGKSMDPHLVLFLSNFIFPIGKSSHIREQQRRPVCPICLIAIPEILLTILYHRLHFSTFRRHCYYNLFIL